MRVTCIHKRRSIPTTLIICVNRGSIMAQLSPRTDTSTDGDTEDKAMGFHSSQSHGPVVSDASDKSRDQKTLRRLAQNREAARKSRLRKKVSFL
ncbi:hypothetical protein M8C21_029717 [Ambrosia artemisiifolia]|uniref:BZIP domain-containing protein n=1 Tax=Ambrosia artemisiifolia TaxID=4212 RepID=A0AAD5CZ60_AMBAR|nr:hypothetical protein M8C21_029717 [Ambrosia artemisiifolia]